MDDIKAKIITAMVGAAMGWLGTSLTLVGRVDALEAGQARIEATLIQVLREVKK
jgi:hypothetical protein